MAVFSISNSKIVGVSAAIPARKISNKEMKNISKEEIELLIETTGINERRLADKNTCASDLCQKAAEKLLAELNWNPSEVEALIFVTQTPDYQVPGNSMMLQDKLGLSTDCLALDINQGCSGYVYGLSTIASIMSASGLTKGLLLVGDTITKLLDPDDKGTVPIFSDAGTATALVFDEGASPMQFNLQTNGNKYDAIITKGRGARNDGEEEGYMTMHGHQIFTFGLTEVAHNIESLIDSTALDKNGIDYFVLHQANQLLNESIRKKMKVDSEKVPSTLGKYGNTSCATIPLTLVSELNSELRSRSLQLMLSGFGVGLSWGSASLQTEKIVCPDLIEVE